MFWLWDYLLAGKNLFQFQFHIYCIFTIFSQNSCNFLEFEGEVSQSPWLRHWCTLIYYFHIQILAIITYYLNWEQCQRSIWKYVEMIRNRRRRNSPNKVLIALVDPKMGSLFAGLANSDIICTWRDFAKPN